MGGRKKSEGVIVVNKRIGRRESERERRKDVEEGTVVAVAKC